MHNRTFAEALEHRRSYYALENQSPVTDEALVQILQTAVKHVPSAFNSQSSRVVLLLGEQHRKLWNIAKETLRKIVPSENFAQTEAKIDGCFAAGYGTVLFFEDRSVVEGLQAAYPSYADRFPTWAEHASAMHQLAVWTMLEDAGLGASLQHYNPLIDDEVRSTWNLPSDWQLIAQMPFGAPVAEPGEKKFNGLTERVRIFR